MSLEAPDLDPDTCHPVDEPPIGDPPVPLGEDPPTCLPHQGFYITEEGVLMKDDTPFYGIGANFITIWERLMLKGDTSGLDLLPKLAAAGVPFIRFWISPFYPNEWDLYFNDKDEFYSRMDQLFAAAEEAGIALVPSMFWNYSCVPDRMGEHMDQLGNPDSKTMTFRREFTAELVSRYRSSPALLGWEMGNELNLGTDLPNGAEHMPRILPDRGTPSSRSVPEDLLKMDQTLCCLREFAEQIAELDPGRPIFSGNSFPRECAWHCSFEGSWKKDTPEECRTMMEMTHPDPMNTFTVHIYPCGGHEREQIGMASEWSQEAKKPLFIGEFGANRACGGGEEKARKDFQELLDLIVEYRVPLSAFWVFDYWMQKGTFNITFENEWSDMIDVVGEANVRLREAASQEVTLSKA